MREWEKNPFRIVVKNDNGVNCITKKWNVQQIAAERKTNICSGARFMSKKLFLNREDVCECISESSMPCMCLCLWGCVGVWFFSTFFTNVSVRSFPDIKTFPLAFVLQPCGLFLSSFLSNRFKTLLWKHHFWFFPVKYFFSLKFFQVLFFNFYYFIFSVTIFLN